MRNFRFVSILLVLFMVSSDSLAIETLRNKTDCGPKSITKAEKDISRLISIGKNGRPFPENERQLKQYCSETRQLTKRIDAFVKRCMEKKLQDFANVFMYSINAAMKQYCRKKTKSLTTLLNAGPCYNKYTRANDICMVQFVNTTKHLVNLPDDSLKIPYGCCNYYQALKCQEDLFDRVPCARKIRELSMQFIRNLFGNVADIICGEYNDSTDRCDQLGPQPKSIKPNNKNYLTFVFALIDTLSSMKSFQFI